MNWSIIGGFLGPTQFFIIILLFMVMQPILLIIGLRFTNNNKYGHAEKRKFSIVTYDLLTEKMFSMVKDSGKRFILANGFDKKTPTELRIWVISILPQIMVPALEFFKREHDNTLMIIPFDSSRPNYQDKEIQAIALEVFSNAKDISLLGKKKIKDLDKEKREAISKMDKYDIGATIELIDSYLCKKNEIRQETFDEQIKSLNSTVDQMHYDLNKSYYKRVQNVKPRSLSRLTKFATFNDSID